MAENSHIQWTGHTWNPWQGCAKVSAGCDHCYMFRDKIRYGQDPETVVRSAKATFNKPLAWKDPARVFTCSWSDWFIRDADPWRDEAWDIVRRTPHLTYQILTKRPARIAKCLPSDWGNGYPNVWLDVTVEDQPTAEARIPQLLQVPAAVRFLSCEPLLGKVDLRLGEDIYCGECDGGGGWVEPWGHPDDPDAGEHHIECSACDGSGYRRRCDDLGWVIVGGESGPGSRPFDIAWARSIVSQCKADGVPVFVKQLGAFVVDRNDAGFHAEDIDPPEVTEWPTPAAVEHNINGFREDYQGAPVRVRLRDSKGGDMNEWPADLRVREFPEVLR